MAKGAAIITGCGKRDGIGAAIARALAQDGWPVVVVDVEPTGVSDRHEPQNAVDADWRGVDSLVDEIQSAGGRATAAFGDVSDPDAVKSIVTAALADHGGVEVLVNNAGAPFSLGHGDIADVPVEEWDRVMAINLRGPFLLAQAVAPDMRKLGRGRIINVASVAGRTGSKANSAYAASKAGVIALAQTLALDLGPDGITSNAVLPGFILTTRSLSGMSKKTGAKVVDAALIAKSMPNIPVGRAGTPADVAATVAFLASDAAAYINGQSIVVDGGVLRL
ncbi:MAG: SDR family oxidoreductase [Brevundimonas sp.]|nr:MAG: SDR family oxidoreductase [Brevundimonas sp.]